jgi:hypothetical protein
MRCDATHRTLNLNACHGPLHSHAVVLTRVSRVTLDVTPSSALACRRSLSLFARNPTVRLLWHKYCPLEVSVPKETLLVGIGAFLRTELGMGEAEAGALLTPVNQTALLCALATSDKGEVCVPPLPCVASVGVVWVLCGDCAHCC